MAALEELRPGVLVKGLIPGSLVTIMTVKHHGTIGVEVTYQEANGRLGSQLLYRDSEAELEIAAEGLPWSFNADGSLFRLVSEAYRISLAYLFDPLIAVHTSLIEPLPHQITAVYENMLMRQPLRYLLADDPGSGKTIMTGLLIKELMIRGDLHRCMIVAPGNLVEQWQDELKQKFHLSFELLTTDRIEASLSGNALSDMPLCIARLDKLSRDVRARERLEQTEWDLVVVDEAHKMSATFFGGEVKYTMRYRLGQVLGKIARHLLLLTATPHNGKEEDFQLFLGLLDEDRFAGRFREGTHHVDVTDLMRHLVKEQLYRFNGTPLFPERLAYTKSYQLSGLEKTLYDDVTNYVQQEFNRADALENNGRKGTVGFALTILQRRLASSPEAIYQSLRRRRERLERRLELERQTRSATLAFIQLDLLQGLPELSEDDLADLEDAPESEVGETEEHVVDQASAARTIAELETEIAMLADLEALALRVRRSGTDRKWEELSSLLQNQAQMFDTHGQRLKLVIFTEHRDTLNYLAARIRTLMGRDEAVVTIHGGLGREERARMQQAFTQDKQATVLVATDAAGEGINLQRAHLMVNYDLPWNPNRLEQRFGRIHRIGQTEVCHLWNLVAIETREGEVFHTLLKKLEEERNALGGQVFDVLGKVLFDDRPLRDLIVAAIRYGDQPEVRARLSHVVDQAMNHQHLQELLEQRALTHEVMDIVRVRQVREEMERAAARRLQPHFIASFFLETLKRLGGRYYEREPHRYEITYVPHIMRSRQPSSNPRAAILRSYERVVFEKELITVPGKPSASFVCPSHPLLDVAIELLMEQHRDLLKQGAILVDPNGHDEQLRVLFYLEHTIQDATVDHNGKRCKVSTQLQFVEMDAAGQMHMAGYAPFLDYRPLNEEEQAIIPALHQQPWLKRDLEEPVRSYAITELVPRHLSEVKSRREEQIRKTLAAVNERLNTEISYWNKRYAQLIAQEAAGRNNARLNSQLARSRVEELSDRLERRIKELELERQISPLPPVLIGGALIVPLAFLNTILHRHSPDQDAALHARETARIERIAMSAVMEIERNLGYIPRDVSADKCGYDIESKDPTTGKLRFIEVKGRIHDATTVTVTRNEVLTALNKPDDFTLAIILVNGDETTTHYIQRPFQKEPDFDATSINYHLTNLLNKGTLQP